MARFSTVATAALIVSASTLSAMAADFGAPPPVVEAQAAEPQLEFATNWYIRGDLGVTRVQGPQLSSDTTFTGAAKPKTGWDVSAGFGYKLNDWFRLDLTADWHKQLSANQSGARIWCGYNATQFGSSGYAYDVNQTCDPSQGAEQKRGAVLVNGYVDLGNFRGVTPYVGAGAGMALIKTSGTISYVKTLDGTPYSADLSPTSTNPLVWIDQRTGLAVNPQPPLGFSKINLDRRVSRQQWNFAWALMGGVAIDVAEKTKLDIGYRYSDYGSVAGVAAANGQVVKQHITNQEVRVGLRYMID